VLFYVALIVMTLLLLVFSICWWRSPRLRLEIEEPKYALLRHLDRHMSILLAGAITCAAGAQPARAADFIKVSDTIDGCFEHKKSECEYKKVGGQFVDKDKKIDERTVADVIKTFMESRKTTSFNAGELGITEESVARHHDQMVEAAVHWQSGVPRVVPKDLAYLFQLPNVAAQAETRMRMYENSTTKACLSVSINDSSSNPQSIEVTSDKLCAWMLPWTVKVGQESWKTYSLDVPRAVAKIAPAGGPNYPLLDGSKYWSDEFYTDEHLWSLSAGEKLSRQAARDLAAGLVGYDEAMKKFELTDSSLASVFVEPYSLVLDLKPKDSSTISSIKWYDHIQDRQPSANWSTFLENAQKCISAADQHTFLKEWLAGGADRTITCEISGKQCYAGLNMSPGVKKAWSNAKMPGNPEIAVDLRVGKGWRATIFLSPGEPRALVVGCRPGEGAHWLDKQTVSSNPQSPAYILVGPDGLPVMSPVPTR
jgi:hypothetical protein